MNIETLEKFLFQLQETLEPIFGKIEISPIDTIKGAWLDRDGEVLVERFGIYCFVLEDLEVVYIGKADESSLAGRIWSHVKTPSVEREASPDRQGIVVYPSIDWSEDEYLANTLRRGEFSLRAFEIKPKHYSSLFEVAVQIFCKDQGSFPALNRRIG